jgi:hypothetical protein
MGLPWESYLVCTHEHICLEREALSISGAVVSPSLFLCVVHTYYAGPGPSSAMLCRRTCDCTTGRPDSNKVFCPETIKTVTFFSSLLFYTPWKQYKRSVEIKRSIPKSITSVENYARHQKPRKRKTKRRLLLLLLGFSAFPCELSGQPVTTTTSNNKAPHLNK